MKINDTVTWLDKCFQACFGIELPNGWLGRPFDNQHRLEDYSLYQDKIILKFDGGRKLTIYDCKEIIFKEESINNLIVFKSFSKLDFLWFPYGSTIEEAKIKEFYNGELILYGYHFS